MDLLKKFSKKIIVSILIVLIICVTFTPQITYSTEQEGTESSENTAEGMTEDELRDKFVNDIVDFYNRHESQCSYDYNFGPGRRATYENSLGPEAGSYCFDCVGWVSCAFHWFLGLGGSSFTYFVDPTSPTYIDDPTHFQRIDDVSQAKKGDVLVSIDNHVAIYIGNGQVLDMYRDETGGLGIRNMNSTYTWDFVAHLYSFEGVKFNEIEGGIDITLPGTGNFDEDFVDLDKIADQFTFDGMPVTITKEHEDVNIFKWFFDGISGFMDYYAGIIFTVAIKGPILNITEGIKAIVNGFLNNISGTEGIDYNIERIIYNEVPILDINFFSNTAAGKVVSSDSAVAFIRNAVATWYVSFRNLVVIAMAAIIIYIGIRMALSTIPQGKATYKRMLIGWIQALVIVFVIHMVMILIINTNNNLVDIFKNSLYQTEGLVTAEGSSNPDETSIYDTIRTRAYDFRISVGFSGTIIYMVLIITWLRFLWVYLKRSFTIIILVIIAPFIGAKYAIDSARGKKGTSFSSWLYDFTFNVLIQTVHALIYVVIMSSVINFAFDSVVGFIISLIFLNFMISADEIFRSIFNFGGRSALSEDTAKQEGYKEVVETFTGAVFVGQVAKGTWNFAKGAGKGITGAGKVVYKEVTKNFPEVKGNVNSKLDSIDETIENKFPQMQEDKEHPNSARTYKARISNLIHYNAKIRRLSRENGIIGVKARNLKKSISSHTKKRYKSNFKIVKDTISGVGSVVLAVPLTVVNTTAGVALMTNGVLKLKKFPNKKHYKVEKEKMKQQSDLEYQREKYTKKRDKIFESIDLLESIQNQEDNIREEVEKKKTDGKHSDKDIDNFKKASDSILVDASSKRISDIIDDYISRNDIDTIDNSSVNDIIDEVAEQIGIDMDVNSTTRSIVGSKAKARIIFSSQKKRQEAQKNSNQPVDIKITKDDITDAIQQSFVDTTVKDDFKPITRDLIKLNKTIKKFEKKAKTKYRKANKFLENL